MARKRKKRSGNKITPAKRILIICEGKTEQIYFKGIRESSNFRDKGFIELFIHDHKKQDPLSLVHEARDRKQQARKEKNPYNAVWVVFDKNSHSAPEHQNAFQQATRHDIDIAFSSISFEIWFLLHFEKTTKAFAGSDGVIQYINQHHHNGYKKTFCKYRLVNSSNSGKA